jgi:hypothetical protein
MRNKGNKSGCGFGDEIVSYMYDELAAADRDRFESHLLACTTCTDDFAAIADARYSVFDWRKREFAALETPAIVIPYDRTEIQTQRIGALAAFGDIVRSWRLAFATGLIAVAAVTVLTLGYLSKPQQVTVSSVPYKINVPAAVQNVANEQKQVDVAKPEIESVKHVDLRPYTPRPVKAHAIKPVVRTHAVLQAPTVAAQTVKSGVNKAPVLSNYEENEDKSLRLADLFDTEVGVR